MATDPTKSIRMRRFRSPLSSHVRGALVRLAALPPSLDVPYLTVTLDWRPAGEDPGRERIDRDDLKRSQQRAVDDLDAGSRRPGRVIFEQVIEQLILDHEPDGAISESLKADRERIREYLANGLDPAAQGAVIVSCSAKDVFETLPLALPVPSRVNLGPVPKLLDVARVVDDYPTYAVLLADQKDATLTFVRYGQPSGAVELEATGYPRHQQQGGWSQRRYQARADERIEAFAQDVAEETRKALDGLEVEMLIVAGDEVITSALDGAFHETVKRRIVDTIALDIRATEQEIIDATLPLAERAEREREEAVVAELSDAVGQGGKGAAGGEATLEALQAGMVQTLVMADTYSEEGWADVSLPLFGVGHVPKEHPAGGDVSAIVPVAIEEELIRLALQQDAEVDIIRSAVPVSEAELRAVPDAGHALPITEAARRLNELGGVGAIFRFEIGETPPETV